MIKKTFWLLLISTLTSFAAPDRPNIIFILTDDQRQDSLPIYGNTFVKTPHIDRLAKESLVFDNAAVTSAICTPSRACYFLGQYERKHSLNFNSGTYLAPEAWALSYPVKLREAGYCTGYVGKNHVPIGEKGYKTGLMEKSFDFWYAGHGHMGFYPKKRHEIFDHAKSDTQIEIVSEGISNFLSEGSYIEGAETFLEKRDDSKPFCLSICLNVPHDSSTSTMKLLPKDDELYRTTYRDKINEIEAPKNFISQKDLKQTKLPKDVLLAQYRQNVYNYADSLPTLRERMVRQYQTITGIDRMLGKIRAQLNKQGIADNTIIVYASDHGLMLGEYGLGGKAFNYEICLRVPLIIHDPRLTKNLKNNRRSPALVQSIDIAPTLLDLAGAPIPSAMQGESLKDIIDAKSTSVRDFAFSENLWSNIFGNPRIESLRGKRYKYIRYFKNNPSIWDSRRSKKTQYLVTPDQRDLYRDWLTASIKGEQPVYEEFYDLQEDPGETVNLLQDPAQQERLAFFRLQCQAHVTAARGDYRTPPAVIMRQDIKPIPIKP